VALFPGKSGRVVSAQNDWDDEWENTPVGQDPVDPELIDEIHDLVSIDTADEPEPEKEPHVPEYSWDIQPAGTGLYLLSSKTVGKCRLHALETIKRVSVNPNDFGNGCDIEFVADEGGKLKEYCYRGCRLLNSYGGAFADDKVSAWLIEFETLRAKVIRAVR
jgi:hypothetical protein